MSIAKANIRLRPLRAIRLKCLECSAGHALEVKNCSDKDCPLSPYRFGTNSKRKGISGRINNLPGSGLLNSKIDSSPLRAPRSHEPVQVAI